MEERGKCLWVNEMEHKVLKDAEARLGMNTSHFQTGKQDYLLGKTGKAAASLAGLI